MGGVFGRVIYAMLLAGVLATATWLALSFQPPSADLKFEALRTEVYL